MTRTNRINFFVIIRIVLFLFVFSLFKVGFPQDSIRITDFGYEPGSRVNAVPFVKKAIEAGKGKTNTVILFPKGRYDFWPQYCEEREYFLSNTDVIPVRTCAMVFEDMHNLTIDGDSSEWVFHGRMQPLTIDNCSNVKIKNISIDWDVPLMAQAEVMSVTSDYIELRIDVTESPYVIENGKLLFVGEGWKSPLRSFGILEFERESKRIRQNGGDAGTLGDDYEKYIATEQSFGVVRLNHKFKKTPLVGNYLVLRHNPRDHAGTFVYQSHNISFENYNLHQSSGLGILSQYSENLSFYKVNCIPNPLKNRYFSGHDDGLHFSGCKGQILVDSCSFKALMDDPVNVHGTNVKVVGMPDHNKLLCRFMQIQTAGFQWAFVGDTIGFIENKSMQTLGTSVVSNITRKDVREFEIEFNSPIPAGIELGDALENISWSPTLHVKNCFFGSNRARGILATTPRKIVIENNVFESSGSAILISGDANGWYESGAVRDLLIRNNTFNDACNTSFYEFCEAIISIFPEIPECDWNKPFHQNITIENNQFYPFDFPVLYAKSVRGLKFTGNKIQRSTQFTSYHHRKHMFSFDYCSGIEIKGNQFAGELLGKDIKLSGTPTKELKVGKNQELTIIQ